MLPLSSLLMLVTSMHIQAPQIYFIIFLSFLWSGGQMGSTWTAWECGVAGGRLCWEWAVPTKHLFSAQDDPPVHLEKRSTRWAKGMDWLHGSWQRPSPSQSTKVVADSINEYGNYREASVLSTAKIVTERVQKTRVVEEHLGSTK